MVQSDDQDTQRLVRQPRRALRFAQLPDFEATQTDGLETGFPGVAAFGLTPG